jgi:hypothetical protein
MKLLASLLLSSSVALAADPTFSVGAFQQAGKTDEGQLLALGYVSGVYDVLAPLICPPATLSHEEMTEVAASALLAADRGLPASQVIREKFLAIYPCVKNNRGARELF